MTKRHLTLTTCMWGDWHTSAFLDIMLPTALAPGNIPAAADLFDVTYQIMVDRPTYQKLDGHPLVKRLMEFCRLEAAVASDDMSLHFNHHVEWFHKATALAKSKGSLLAFIPPDVAWSNNSIGSMAWALKAGAAGVAGPHFRVTDETFRPALFSEWMSGFSRPEPIGIPPGNLVWLGAEHMHPLSCAAMAGSRHGRIALEMMWRVPNEGFILRQGCRELTAFDPGRIDLTQLWYAAGNTKPEDLHIVTDSDEMMMLSLHPVNRDLLLYHRNKSIVGADIALQMIHEQNDTPLNEHFAAQTMRLHYGAMSEQRWRHVEAESDRVMSEAVHFWKTFKQVYCDRDERAQRTEENFAPILNEVMIDYAKGRGVSDPVPASLERWALPQAEAAE